MQGSTGLAQSGISDCARTTAATTARSWTVDVRRSRLDIVTITGSSTPERRSIREAGLEFRIAGAQVVVQDERPGQYDTRDDYPEE